MNWITSPLDSHYPRMSPRIKGIYIALFIALTCIIIQNYKINEYNKLVTKNIENTALIVNIFNPEIKKASRVK